MMSGTTDNVARCGGDVSRTVACLLARPEPATVHHRSGFQILTSDNSVSTVVHVNDDPVVATALANKNPHHVPWEGVKSQGAGADTRERCGPREAMKSATLKNNQPDAPLRCAASRGNGGDVQRSFGLGVGGGSHGAEGQGDHASFECGPAISQRSAGQGDHGGRGGG